MDMPMLDKTLYASRALPLQVRKRDGATLQSFDRLKVETAVRKAWQDAMGIVDEKQLQQVARLVMSSLSAETASVEQIQDAVEVALMKHQQFDVAKAYILYRQKRLELRQGREKPDTSAIASYIHFSKYARHQPDLHRREVFAETVDRVEAMHLQHFAHLQSFLPEIRWAFDQVRQKRVLPSMRSLQFGGPAIEKVNNRMFNCSFSLVDRPRVFAEAIFLLLSGCGVGYSVQFDHVEKLPPLRFIDRKKVAHHVIMDTIEGWADALHALVEGYIEGHHVEFAYHLLRPAGAPLRTSGGKAPGHMKLKEALEQVRLVLDGAQGRKLRPIECHDIMCHAADAVLSGGIRRSAMIALFSPEDSEMMIAKTGNWYQKHPWRQNANNSVMLKRDDVKQKQFKRIFQMTREWGEPGFFFCNDLNHGTNPCGEIGLNPLLTADEDTQELLLKKGIEAPKGTALTGWAFCNLCEINAAKLTSLEDFKTAARAATIIGTLQAAYTRMPYLGKVSEAIAEREALLGIGMTGMLDAPSIACNPEYQAEVAANVIEWNRQFAEIIGTRPAARTTCIKPSGTTSLALNCVASGHHPHHAKRYIRRVTADELETVFQAFKTMNPHMCVKKPDGKWVIEFPVEAPEGAIVREDLGAIQFMEMVRSTQVNWVLNGTARPESSPGLNHNVSNTVTVKPDEWEAVANYLWKHREYFTGVTLLPYTGDKDYAFAPNETVVTEADEQRWGRLIAHYKPVDYTAIFESEDSTDLTGEAACAGGSCQIV